MKFKNPKGFSLVELMIVIAILAILAAVAVPSFQRFAINSDLKTAAREIQGDFFICKERAIAENTEYSITFNIGANTYTKNCGAGDIATKSLASYSGNARLVSSITPPCYTGATTSFNVGTVNFQTRGTMNPNTGTMLLTNDRGSTATITYNVTGRTHVCFDLK